MKKVLCGLVVALMMTGNGYTNYKEDLCNAFVEMEEEFNQNLPKKIDDFTEIINMKVNCDTEIIVYTKRVLVDENSLKRVGKKESRGNTSNFIVI